MQENSNQNDNLFVHLADLHLSPRTTSISKRDPITNRMVRDLDMSAALKMAVDDIIQHSPLPSTAVIAGDIFDTYQGSQDAIIDCANQFKRLRDAGVKVIGIAGNHDTPTQRLKTPAFLVLKNEFEKIAEDDGVKLAYASIEHVLSGNIEYVLLPHLVALNGDFNEDDLKPVFLPENTSEAKRFKKVLVVHGIAAGDPSLRQMDEMKQVPIAKWIMDMDWDYIAFGHYHKPGWIPGYEGKAAYCGSLENTVISGPDLCPKRGPVYIELDDDFPSNPSVPLSSDNEIPPIDAFMSPIDIRKIIPLPRIDAAEIENLSADTLDTAIKDELESQSLDDAIVTLDVINVPRNILKMMPRRSFQEVVPNALHVRVRLVPAGRESFAPTLNGNRLEGNDEKNDTIHYDNESLSSQFLPLQSEIEKKIDELVSARDIRQDLRDRVLKSIESFC